MRHSRWKPSKNKKLDTDDHVGGQPRPDSRKKRDPRQRQRTSWTRFWPNWDPSLDRVGIRRDVLPFQGLNALEVRIARHLPLLRRIPLRAKVPRRLENIIGDALHLQIEADPETERGHPKYKGYGHFMRDCPSGD